MPCLGEKKGPGGAVIARPYRQRALDEQARASVALLHAGTDRLAGTAFTAERGQPKMGRRMDHPLKP